MLLATNLLTLSASSLRSLERLASGAGTSVLLRGVRVEVWKGSKRVLDGAANDYVKAFYDPQVRRFAIIGIDGRLKAIDPRGRVLASVPLETTLDPIRATGASPYVLYNEGARIWPAGRTSIRTDYDRLQDQYESCFDLRGAKLRWRRSVRHSGRFLALDGRSVWTIGATLARRERANAYVPEIFFSTVDLASGKRTALYRPKIAPSLSLRLFERGVVGQLWDVRFRRKNGRVASIGVRFPVTSHQRSLNAWIPIAAGGRSAR